MTSRKNKKLLSIILVLTMILTLVPATLGFAAYDSLEAFVENVYKAVYERVPDEEGFNWWVEKLSNQEQTACQFIGFVLLDAPEFKEKFANISNEQFVKKLYNVLFNREADAEGLKFWVEQLQKGYSRKYVIYAMMQDVTNAEFLTFCENVGIKVGRLKLDASDYPVPEPEKLEVVSVSATNFGEIDVVFNTAIDKATISKSNIKINNVALGTNDKATLLEDGKTLRIFRPEPGFVTAQNMTRKLSISGIKSVGGIQMTDLKDYEVKFVDRTLPELVSARAIGNKRIELTFNEPIKNNTDAKIFSNYKIDDKYVVGVGTPIVDGRTITIDLANRLTAGEHKVSIASQKFEDYAGYKAFEDEEIIYVVDDKTVPTATILEVRPEKVVVRFDKEITDAARAYWMDGTVKKSSDKPVQDSSDKTKYTFNFTAANYLPLTAITLYLENVEDFFGNKAATLSFQVQATPDVDRPVALKAESTKENEILVTFNEEVDYNTGTYIVKDKDGKEVNVGKNSYTPSGATQPDKKVVRLTGTLTPDKSPYTVIVKDVEDLSSLRNKSLETAFSVTVPDKTAPSVASVDVNTSEYYVTITFNEQVTTSSVADIANYSYLEPGKGYVALPSEAYVTALADGKSVKIQFPASWDNGASTFSGKIIGENTLNIRNIEDLAGNKLTSALVTVPGTQQSAAAVSSAKATDKNTIVLSLDGGVLPIDVYAGDFVVKAGSKQLSVTQATLNINKREITLTIAENLTASGKYIDASYEPKEVTVEMATPVAVTKTATGKPVTVSDGRVQDTIRPDIQAVKFGANPRQTQPSVTGDRTLVIPETYADQILIIFNENVKLGGLISGSGFTGLQNALVIKDADGARLYPGTDYTISVLKGDGDPANSTDAFRMVIVKITKSGFNGTISEVSLPEAVLTDEATPANNNKAFNKSSEGIVIKELTAPSVSGVSYDAVNKIITITYTENILNNKASLADLKAAITLKRDGSTDFDPLDEDDEVEIIGNQLKITLETALSGTENKVKVAAEALKDSLGNKTVEFTSDDISAS